jgi:hypothetical protein
MIINTISKAAGKVRTINFDKTFYKIFPAWPVDSDGFSFGDKTFV